MKILQDAKERGGLGLPDLKAYFSACFLMWMKDWMSLKNRRLLELEGHELRFGWHGYLWYDKAKVNVEFNNHYVRCVILRIWNKYKPRLCQKTPLWVSSQEAMHRRDFTRTHKWLTYNNILEMSQGEYKLKSREELLTEGYTFNGFLMHKLWKGSK